jgi:hypothetical protein
MSIKVNLDTLDLPIFNPISITTDKEALHCINFIINSAPITDTEELKLLLFCKNVVTADIGENIETFGPLEIIGLSELAQKYTLYTNHIMAISDHIVQSLDFFENQELPAEKFLDVGLLIGNLSYPGWEKSFAV